MLQSLYYVIQGGAVLLIRAAVDVTHPAIVVDDERGGVRDIDSVRAEWVMEAVVHGYAPSLIEQEQAGDGMFLEKLCGLPQSISFFRGNEGQLCARRRNLR